MEGLESVHSILLLLHHVWVLNVNTFVNVTLTLGSVDAYRDFAGVKLKPVNVQSITTTTTTTTVLVLLLRLQYYY